MTHYSKKNIWIIAGSDCSGRAGLQADIKVASFLGLHPCTIVTSVTAQNNKRVYHLANLSPTVLQEQINSLKDDAPPSAIKIGMLGNSDIVRCIVDNLKLFPELFIVCDPILFASSGFSLLEADGISALKEQLFPIIDLLTPNIPETEHLTGLTIKNDNDIPLAAQRLISMGVKSVLIKGGHTKDNMARDFFYDGSRSCWFNSNRVLDCSPRGTGCALSTAIVSAIALGYPPLDAITIAKTFLNQSLRLPVEADTLGLAGWPDCPEDLPWITELSEDERYPFPFLSCTPPLLGLYPLVDSANDACKLINLGVSTIQLRLKEGENVDQEIKESIAAANKADCRLFINDYWELAIQYGAYGVHLGQSDLQQADVPAIHKAGLRLGTSTHSYSELARVNRWRPSYIAMGTVFPSPSKPGLINHLGVLELARLTHLSEAPVVAIGGLTIENAEDVIGASISGVAVISDIQHAQNLPQRVAAWQQLFKGRS